MSHTTPGMLIRWMREQIDEPFPCDVTPFKNTFGFLTDRSSNTSIRILDYPPKDKYVTEAIIRRIKKYVVIG